MSENIIVFDIETKHTFDEVGGRGNFAKLGVTIVGTYLYNTSELKGFFEKDVLQLEKLFETKPLLIGFNSKKFDIPVLQPYLKTKLSELPHLDIMEEIEKVVGHRVSLQSVAEATLGIGKSGHGLDAIKYYREGEFDKLEKYCLDDVRITRDVFEYGAKNGEVFFTSKYGPDKRRVPVTWKVSHPFPKPDPQRSLF